MVAPGALTQENDHDHCLHPQALPAHAVRQADPRQPARRADADDAAPGRRLLRALRPARDDHHPRPGPAAVADPRDGDPAAGRGAGPGDALPAEPGPGPRPAGLPAGVHGVHRRAEPDGPVQGEGSWRRGHQGVALHLPRADGGRHPALPAGRGPGGRRPASARRAHPRPRGPLQPGLRGGVHGPGDHHALGRRARHGPGRPHPEDEQVGRRRRVDLPARRTRRGPPQGVARGHRLRDRPVPRCGRTGSPSRG